MRYIVAHHGVPIGGTDLPDGRRWAGGLLEPYPAFDPLRAPLSAAAAGAEVALRILSLPTGERPDLQGLEPALAAAVERVAELRFDLRDEAGLDVAADVVRLADPGDALGVRVRAYFQASTAGVAAVLPGQQSSGTGIGSPDV